MTWNKHDYDDIPGTFVFDGKTSHAAYGLNKLLFSFNQEGNRKAYERDPAAYAERFGLTDRQKEALLGNDYPELLRLGANIYYLAKLAVPRGYTMQDTSAAFHGITTAEFQAKLDAKAEGLLDKLEKAGFWNG